MGDVSLQGGDIDGDKQDIGRKVGGCLGRNFSREAGL